MIHQICIYMAARPLEMISGASTSKQVQNSITRITWVSLNNSLGFRVDPVNNLIKNRNVIPWVSYEYCNENFLWVV